MLITEKVPSANISPEVKQRGVLEGWQGRTVYQIYPNTFNEARAEGEVHTGRGSIRGVIEKLDYLDELGIGAVWLSPFYPSPLKDGGYDISDHTNVDLGLGTIEDIDELIEQCHARDMKVLFDFVPNHTSDEHEWFRASCRNPEGQFGDFYVWADPKKLAPGEPPLPHNIVGGDRLDGLPQGYTVPNNWSSIFSIPEREKLKAQYGGAIPDGIEVPARSAWVWHAGRAQFYLAEFTKEQPTLNWNNQNVRQAQADVMHFWLKRGVDGFRVDVMNHIGKDYALTDELPVDEGEYNKHQDNPHDQWKQERLVSYHPMLAPCAYELIEVLDNYPDTRFVLEDWITALSDGFDTLSRLRPDRATVFNFQRLLKTNRDDWDAKTHKKLLDTYYELFQAPDLQGSLPNQVDSNHDVDRVATRLGLLGARAAALIKLTTPGTPYIYQGEEGSLPNVSYDHIPPHRRKDDDLGLRDGQRTPLPWNTSPNAGFSQAHEQALWLPVDPNYRALNLADQTRDPLSPYSLFRALIAARNYSTELARGDYLPRETDHGNVLAFGRAHPAARRQYLSIVNFSGEATEAAVIDPQQALARIAISSQDGLVNRPTPMALTRGKIRLKPYEALLLEPVA